MRTILRGKPFLIASAACAVLAGCSGAGSGLSGAATSLFGGVPLKGQSIGRGTQALPNVLPARIGHIRKGPFTVLHSDLVLL